jgi:hypothetical protein
MDEICQEVSLEWFVIKASDEPDHRLKFPCIVKLASRIPRTA